MTVLPLGKWSIGRPLMRSMRTIFRRIPPFNYCVRGALREDRISGFVAEGKKGAASFTTQDATPEPTSPPVYVDVYTEERQTGHPHLYTTKEMGGTAFEGAAVQRAARTGAVRSGFGPF